MNHVVLDPVHTSAARYAVRPNAMPSAMLTHSAMYLYPENAKRSRNELGVCMGYSPVLSSPTSKSWNMPHEVMTAGSTSGSKFPVVPLMNDVKSANVRKPIIGKYRSGAFSSSIGRANLR